MKCACACEIQGDSCVWVRGPRACFLGCPRPCNLIRVSRPVAGAAPWGRGPYQSMLVPKLVPKYVLARRLAGARFSRFPTEIREFARVPNITDPNGGAIGASEDYLENFH